MAFYCGASDITTTAGSADGWMETVTALKDDRSLCK